MDLLAAFADRLESDASEGSADAVRRLAAERPGTLAEAVEAVAEDLESGDPDVRVPALRQIHAVSRVSGDAVQSVAFELIPHLDDERTRPYAGGALREALDSAGEVVPPVEELAAELSTEGTHRRTLRYLFWVSKTSPGSLEPATDALVDRLEDEDETVREYAVKTLYHARRKLDRRLDGVDPTLLELTDDPNPAVRANALALLGELVFDTEDTLDRGAAETVDAAVYHLRDDRTSVRLTATTVLDRAERLTRAMELGPDRWRRIADALADALEADSELLVRRATSLIWSFARERPDAFRFAVDDLFAYVSEDAGPLRGNVMRAVASVSEDHPEALAHALPRCAEMVEDAVLVRYAASVVENVLRHDPDDASAVAPALIAGLETPDREGRRAVARALAVVGRERSDEASEAVRALAAADADGEIGDPLSVLADEDPEFVGRRVAGLAENLRADGRRSEGFLLVQLAETDRRTVEPAVPVLADLLESPDSDVRDRAAETLGRLGTEYPETVVPVVERMAGSLDRLGRFERADLSTAIRSVAERDPTLVSAAADDIAAQLATRNSTARRSVARTLSRLGEAEPSVIPEFATPLVDVDSDESERPLAVLGTERPEFVRSVLDDARADLPEVGRGTAEGIGELVVEVAGTDAGRELVGPTLDEVVRQASADSERGRRNAAIALRRVAEWRAELVTDAVEPLAGRFVDGEERRLTRRNAAKALCKLASVVPQGVDDAVRRRADSVESLAQSFPRRRSDAVEALLDRVAETSEEEPRKSETATDRDRTEESDETADADTATDSDADDDSPAGPLVGLKAVLDETREYYADVPMTKLPAKRLVDVYPTVVDAVREAEVEGEEGRNEGEESGGGEGGD
ncbi:MULTISPECIES: HEAT repeat domain-containing protein [Halorussus]|uniref:HEAT repeat domain-containing protein n=1 Tax=Halorussus TaxID=1070314 RepID=UPI00209E7C8A|nr:HEAT repeat domain-containing protein [Halorussus vallis]USZ77008.1 hypothetical protein NGM07_06685 [Halorussus vallis]